ncbi:hypothetical protein EMIHUDRAFT_439010, partial [Emiliania huxleyi CCMP1516]|uniref:Uncharacterized protein n=2 Tax=Emiliania huxleyi TaxID=2903 RepID=A0A0D3I1M7_EMIH1
RQRADVPARHAREARGAGGEERHLEGRGDHLDVHPRAAAPDRRRARHRRHRLHRERPEGARRARRRQGALRHRGRRAGRHLGARR